MKRPNACACIGTGRGAIRRTAIEPPYWVVREGPTLIAASPLMPVRVSIAGTEVAGAWSSDPLVVAERQRQGLGGGLLRAWDRGTGIALGAALSSATRGATRRNALAQGAYRCPAS